MQSVRNDGMKTFLNGTVPPVRIERFRRVKLVIGTVTNPPEVEYAAGVDPCIGITEDYAEAGEALAVWPINKPGTFRVVANKAIARGAAVYGAVDGRVSDAILGTQLFIALDAATALGDIIEVIEEK